MKTIRYSLFKGKPHNLDDCIDFSHKTSPSEVSLNLAIERNITEGRVLKYFLGLYEWKFPDMIIEFEKYYGCCFLCEGKERWELDIKDSNRRLESDMIKLKKLNIAVKGGEKRFGYSWVYDIQKKED